MGSQDSAVTVLTRPWAAPDRNLSIAGRGKTSTPTVGPTQPLFISGTWDSCRGQSGGSVKLTSYFHLVPYTWLSCIQYIVIRMSLQVVVTFQFCFVVGKNGGLHEGLDAYQPLSIYTACRLMGA